MPEVIDSGARRAAAIENSALKLKVLSCLRKKAPKGNETDVLKHVGGLQGTLMVS